MNLTKKRLELLQAVAVGEVTYHPFLGPTHGTVCKRDHGVGWVEAGQPKRYQTVTAAMWDLCDNGLVVIGSRIDEGRTEAYWKLTDAGHAALAAIDWSGGAS